MTETMTIVDGPSLERWRSAVRSIVFPGAVPPADFALPGFDNRRLTHEAARYGRACGCTASGLAMTGAVIFVAARLSLDSRPLAAVGPFEWLQFLLIVVAAAVGGKLAGLFWARRRLVRLAETVAAELDRQGERAIPHRS